MNRMPTRSILSRRSPVALAALLLAGVTAFAQPAPPAPTGAPVAAAGTTPAATPAATPPATPPAPPAGPRARPPRPERPAAEAGVPTTVTGRVARWLPNPNGDVDGLLLEDGTQVSLPPTQSAKLVQGVKLRDSVQIAGTRASANGRVLRATQIRNAAGTTLVTTEAEPGATPPAPPTPPAPRDAAALTQMTANGRIATLLYTGRGDVNGVLLDDGTAVRFPPHVGAAMGQDLKVGGTLVARGYGTRNSVGSALEATRLGSSDSTARDVFPPLARAGAPVPPAPALPSVPAAPRGPSVPSAPPATPVPPAPPAPAASPATR